MHLSFILYLQFIFQDLIPCSVSYLFYICVQLKFYTFAMLEQFFFPRTFYVSHTLMLPFPEMPSILFPSYSSGCSLNTISVDISHSILLQFSSGCVVITGDTSCYFKVRKTGLGEGFLWFLLCLTLKIKTLLTPFEGSESLSRGPIAVVYLSTSLAIYI